MKRVTAKIKPASGFSSIFHLFLTILLPVFLYVLVRINLVQIAIAFIFLSKWRMFAMRPRHWPAIIRANAADIIIGVSTVIFMVNSSTGLLQLIWAVAYALWLVLIKPATSLFGVSMQALIAMVFGLTAIYLEWGGAEAIVLVIMTWGVCNSAARHFFTSFDEPHGPFLASAWAFFGASLAWLLSHWLLYYQVISQVTLIIGVLGFGLATMYYLQKTDRLSTLMRRQILFIMVAVIIIMLAFSDWGDKIV